MNREEKGILNSSYEDRRKDADSIIFAMGSEVKTGQKRNIFWVMSDRTSDWQNESGTF